MYKYAQVIVENRATATDKPFTYLIGPEIREFVQVGMRVVVPFGRGNRKIIGIVIGLKNQYDGKYRLKPIIKLIDEKPIVSKDLIDLSLWMSKEFLSPYLDSLQRVLPPGDFKEIKTEATIGEKFPGYQGQLSPLEQEIIDFILSKEGATDLDLLREEVEPSSPKLIEGLEKAGLLNLTFKIETSVEKKYEKYLALKDKNLAYEELMDRVGKRSYKQREIVDYLLGQDLVPLKTLMKEVHVSLSTVKALEKKDLIKILDKEVFRPPIQKDIKPYYKHKLYKEQKHALDTILGHIKSGSPVNKFLIHGVTGSGKTEIYLQLVEEMIRLNKDTIILVPEISLTPQTIDRFVGRFGENVAVLHSRLSYGERFDEWRRIKEGRVKIVVGARSAIFAPFANLGLIIIDEEHETTYKAGMNPKYTAIQVAEKRCDQLNAYLVKGSATPSIESYYKAEEGDLKLINLRERINKKDLPEVRIIDMREELKGGNTSIFSLELYDAIRDNLKENKQTILFLNRRGYSTFVSCRQCGYVVKCNSCDISMTYYMRENKLKCHYCGLAVNPPHICPVCRSKYIKYFGIGTEKVETYTRELFPQARIERMDLDTTSKKGSHEAILNRMKEGKIDILIGTQMIGKGLDFENVTLVGVITADTSLNLPDFRASERTFQLITQVAGRAGRGDHTGRVIVQTYNPDHYSIQAAKEHDFLAFYRQEILLRREFNYPPFSNIVSITIYGENKQRVAGVSRDIYESIMKNMRACGLEELMENVIGPNPAPLERIKNNFRFQVLIKSSHQDMDRLKNIIEWVCILNKEGLNFDGIRLNIDINPNSIL